jgi:transposase
MQKKQLNRRKRASAQAMRIINPNAAGIDLGSRSHFVALPEDRNENVREFQCYTEDLEKMAEWLLVHRITTVAMESTGVFWVPVYDVLERAGLDVQLVNARHYRNVPGRKTDIQDCQWLQYLHQCGLVRGSFRPADAICEIRSYERQRENLVEEASRHLQRMHKAMEQMNIQLHKSIRDISGLTGMTIIKAIVGGERDANKLAEHRDPRCKRTKEEIAKALRGNWREEHLFCLEQELYLYETLQGQIRKCEAAAMQCWKNLPGKVDATDLPTSTKGRKVDIALRRELYRVTGNDLFAADGLGATIVPKLLSEIGTDVSAWPTEAHFVSWANICPPNNITGGKRHKGRRRQKTGRVAELFRLAAQSVANAKSAIGAYYRRKRGHRGSGIANGATANKIARIFYRLMKFGEAYVAQSAEHYEVQFREKLINRAVKTLEAFGMEVTVSLTQNQALT